MYMETQLNMFLSGAEVTETVFAASGNLLIGFQEITKIVKNALFNVQGLN